MSDNDEQSGAPERLIDARGLACPLPVLKLRKALNGAQPGSIWTLLATDPVAARDVPAFCAATGHEIVAQEREDHLRFQIRAGAR